MRRSRYNTFDKDLKTWNFVAGEFKHNPDGLIRVTFDSGDLGFVVQPLIRAERLYLEARTADAPGKFAILPASIASFGWIDLADNPRYNPRPGDRFLSHIYIREVKGVTALPTGSARIEFFKWIALSGRRNDPPAVSSPIWNRWASNAIYIPRAT